tara:strand:- start:3936 stop:4901 length:966 start_codon:yes stop_codon:yes gene_type:complete
MKILITGSAGFIGFNFAKFLLTHTRYKIIGIDNFNDYYDVNLKKNRNKILLKFKNYNFKKIDICNKKILSKIFKREKFDYVFHFAAQAGVRYSIKNPRKYMDSNYLGFFNILDNSNFFKIKRLFYASSSSIYGENRKFPLKEKYPSNPKNIYGLSKKSNEELSEFYNRYYGLKSVGLRFFTVYGEWGRPDMMMIKYISAFFSNKKFVLNNFGNHIRDFTYVGDVVKILFMLLKKNNKVKDFDILNICSNRPIPLKKIINVMRMNKITPKIKKTTLQMADIVKTHGDNKKILNITKFKKFSSIEESIRKTIMWYKDYFLKDN